jgi:ureidoglycolate lyase
MGVPRVVVAEPLTPERFAPFGDVVSAGRGAGRDTNLGTAVRFDWTSALESTRPAARANLAVFRSAPQTLPFTYTLLERHPHSTQAFLPMACARFLIGVAPARADGAPDPGGLIAFVGGPGQGFNLRRGVWHHPILALDAPAEFAMLAWEDGSAEDCVEHPLAAPVRVVEAPGR